MLQNHHQQQLAAGLHNIGNMSRGELLKIWKKMYRALPPKGISRRLLEQAAAYHLQTRQFGRLQPHIRRKLLRSPLSGLDKPPSLRPGTILVREWRGTVHRVEVMGSGFMWRQKIYGSLSEIARAITGTRWSGPRFFGL